MARSRRACPERSRRNPGDASWRMLLGAFRPQTTTGDGGTAYLWQLFQEIRIASPDLPCLPLILVVSDLDKWESGSQRRARLQPCRK